MYLLFLLVASVFSKSYCPVNSIFDIDKKCVCPDSITVSVTDSYQRRACVNTHFNCISEGTKYCCGPNYVLNLATSSCTLFTPTIYGSFESFTPIIGVSPTINDPTYTSLNVTLASQGVIIYIPFLSRHYPKITVSGTYSVTYVLEFTAVPNLTFHFGLCTNIGTAFYPGNPTVSNTTSQYTTYSSSYSFYTQFIAGDSVPLCMITSQYEINIAPVGSLPLVQITFIKVD